MLALLHALKAYGRERGAAYRSLPWPLQLPAMVLITGGLISFLGLFFTLPPGPLCDEGMWIFMEGGCDWGESNIFFHTKLGLLLVANVVLAVLVFAPHIDVRGVAPALLVLGALALTPSLAAGGKCDTYYGHPNGNLAQMSLEVLTFSLLGGALVGALRRLRPAARGAALIALNGLNVALFHALLLAEPHWSWSHTALIAGTHAFLSLCVLLTRRATPNGLQLADAFMVLSAMAVLVPLRAGLEAPLMAVLATVAVIGVIEALVRLWRVRV